MAANISSKDDDDFMVGPGMNQRRIIIQTCLLVVLLVFGFICQGTMVFLFLRFKSLRCLSNYLLIDLTIVEFLDISVNIPLFIQYFLFTKKAELSKQTRWFIILFHRFFLLNDLLTQLALIIDCFLAIKFGKRFTFKKSSMNISAFIAFKWAAILGMLVAFSHPADATAKDFVTEEAYRRILFGPNQTVWKTVIPSCLGFSIVFCLMINRLIRKSRSEVAKRHGMRIFGRGSINSSKAVTTLLLIMVMQTVCRVPATTYSYLATDSRIEHNRWFAFFCYFFLFLSSSILPIIYFSRANVFQRALKQIKQHPFGNNAYLDYAARHGVKQHRNGRSFAAPRSGKDRQKKNSRQGQGTNTPTEQTKDTSVSSSRTLSRRSLHSIITQEWFPDSMTKGGFFAGNQDDTNSKDLSHEKKRNSSRRCFSDSRMFEMRKLQSTKANRFVLNDQDSTSESERRFIEDDIALCHCGHSYNDDHTHVSKYFGEIQKQHEENKTPESNLDDKTSSDKDVQILTGSPKTKVTICNGVDEDLEPSPLLDNEDAANFFYPEKTVVLDEEDYERRELDVFDTKL